MPLPDWARAHGAPLLAARIRTSPRDFQVTEELGWDCSGNGEHDFLWIEKTGTNTEWLARQLARFAGVAARDVGFAGLKDRHAVTRQWFSVPRWHGPDWQALDIDGVSVLDVRRNDRKLRRGAHAGNAFRIVLRGGEPARHADAIEQRVRTIRVRGVPNYFGEQRFGRDGANLALADAWASGKHLPRHPRSLAISTIRSFLFNETLQQRVRAGTWDRVQPGDQANLDGTGSVFVVDEADEEIERRCREMDIHPAGELAGDGSRGEPQAWLTALAKARVAPGTRSLRLKVGGLHAEIADAALVLGFWLPRGAFATAVLREIAATTDAAGTRDRSPAAPGPGPGPGRPAR